MSSPLILLVDDDEDLCRYCRAALKPVEARLLTCGSVAQARQILTENPVDLLLADLELPDGTGLDLLRIAHEQDSDCVVTLITGKATVPSALEAMKQGAFDYLLKPLPPTQLRANAQKALKHRRLLLENRNLRTQLAGQRADRTLIGRSPGMLSVLGLIDKLAPRDTTVLITGESGTGKELIARTLHDRSPRSEGPFVAINCSALPETLLESELFGHEKGAFTGATSRRRGVFAQADGGTLLLDEIGTMPPGLQTRLLRVLEEGRIRPVGAEKELAVNVRILAATNADLQALIHQGTFRKDLYFRLNVVTIAIPPLRQRREDIALLTRHFLKRFAGRSRAKKLAPETLARLERYAWPGNVRQLANVLERACLLAEKDGITLDLLPEEILSGRADPVSPLPPGETRTLAELEKEHIRRTLEATGWQKSAAAKHLGISRRTLYNKMRLYEITPPEKQP